MDKIQETMLKVNELFDNSKFHTDISFNSRLQQILKDFTDQLYDTKSDT